MGRTMSLGSAYTFRHPVSHAIALYEELSEKERGGRSLADVYRQLSGGSSCASAEHERFQGFFNGQARSVLAARGKKDGLRFWAGMPERAVAVRQAVFEGLEGCAVTAEEDPPAGRLDPETRALVLAHNELDAELHGHFRRAHERGAMSPRRGSAGAATAVCVLGMVRSGTSLTTRVLNVLGVDLGGEAALMPAAAGNNPAGFWEHQGIADLNEDILATLGDAPRQRWRHPPALEPGWELDPRLEGHRRLAQRVLRESFDGLSLWGWKDPRTCLTLPFWERVLAEMDGEEPAFRFVICVRHPLDVAASLEERDGVGRDEALRLWRRYTADALRGTEGRPRTVVSYEAYFEDWESQVRRLAAFLGLPSPSESQRAEIAGHLDDRLWHHRGGDGERTGDLPPEVAELYAELLAEAV